MKDVGINQCLFATKKGGFGIGPLVTWPGDICCLIYRADIAFILQPSSNTLAYKLLGKAFVHLIINREIEGML